MHPTFGRFRSISIATTVLLGLSAPLQAQDFPVTPQQKATAAEVAQTGIALDALAANAPERYTVKHGDTLWAISGMFLKSPWRWPELWGMNKQDIRNPHRIYPGQQLYLDKANGRATLRTGLGGSMDGLEAPIATVRVSPRTRSESLADAAIPTLSPQAIEPFLSEPLIVDELTFSQAPRIVATQEGRVMLSRGDRAYARGQYGGAGAGAALSTENGDPLDYRVFRNATPLKDPTTQEILGYEAHYVGKVELVRGESTAQSTDKNGSAVAMVGANQMVVINRGTNDGLERGHVMAILKDGERLRDKTDSAQPQIKLPNERNGLMMVFRTFERVSYALVLQVNDGVRVGDRVINPE